MHLRRWFSQNGLENGLKDNLMHTSALGSVYRPELSPTAMRQVAVTAEALARGMETGKANSRQIDRFVGVVKEIAERVENERNRSVG